MLRELKKLSPTLRAGEDAPPAATPTADLAASFQAAVIEVLTVKTVNAAREHNAKAIFIAGGVSANKVLQSEMSRRSGGIPVRFPPLILCTDNAAMIAAAGYQRFMAGQRDSLDMDVKPNWKLT